jgi:hypothetical protein
MLANKTAEAHNEAALRTAAVADSLKESADAALGGWKPQGDVSDVMKVIAKPEEIPGDPLSDAAAAEARKGIDDDILDMDGQYPGKEYTREKLDGLQNPESIQHEGNWDALIESFSRNPSVDAFVPLMTQQSVTSVAQLPEGNTKQLVSVNFPLKVHTAKLFEEGFANPAMAQSDFSQDQLTQLHTFEQILNQQPSNSTALLNFV